MVIFGQSGCIRGKVVVFGKMVVFGLTWLYTGKNGCIRAKRFFSGKSGCIGAKVVVLGKK